MVGGGVIYNTSNSPDMYLTDNGYFKTLTKDFTIAAWVYYEGLNYTANFIDSENTYNSCINIVNNAHHGSTGLFLNRSTIISGLDSAIINQWNHIACSRKNKEYFFFINGVLQGSATSEINFFDNFINKKMFILSHDIDGYKRRIYGNLWDFTILPNKCKWISNFNPPLTELRENIIFNNISM